jgi:Lrp/AsnC family transcriptional regulator, regulator of ectoine-degradation genes
MTATKAARPAFEPDRCDLEILKVVERQGRISKKALARAVGLSISPCYVRLQRLEREGYIRAYRGIIDAKRFGPFVRVYAEFTLERHRSSDFSRFERAILHMPEAVECNAVGGGFDYLVKFVVPDVTHYQRAIDDLLERDIGISTYASYFVTAVVKEDVAVPLDMLAAASRRRRVIE